MILRQSSERPGYLTITFAWPAIMAARTVHLVGDFNDWNRQSLAMVFCPARNTWEITLELARGGVYRFRYLVDGSTWHNDWQADRYETNPFGGENSVLET
jgi:1,4-alpha-glucan branching enzyme